jgi:cell division protein FtsZ
MPLNLSAPETTELKPRILVCGVGGAGGNAVNNMIDAQLEGVDFVVANTDAQALQRARTDRRIQMGAAITEGLGAGARPEVGEQAAEDSLAEIQEHLQGAHMVFITAGMGGGTGTGAAPVIARAAREQGILTVGVVTKPFHFEGTRRMRLAEAASRLQEACRYADHHSEPEPVPDRQREDDLRRSLLAWLTRCCYSGVRGITDLMVMPGLINLDFADVRAVMNEMGKAMMGTGEAKGEKRAVEAANNAIANPLLDDVSMKGAKGVLINITGGMDMTLFEVDEAANEIPKSIPRSDLRPELRIRVSVVANIIEPAPCGTVTPVERQTEPLVRRASDAVAVNETPQHAPVACRGRHAGPARLCDNARVRCREHRRASPSAPAWCARWSLRRGPASPAGTCLVRILTRTSWKFRPSCVAKPTRRYCQHIENASLC